ncbi:hypothetical protein [Chitinimonas sp. BJYL2]|uniref:hypothetical protein n=1 Tax=Chitinimonas sp. BJYL2 TaxID=2976696 RepID=UPI0022B3E4F4|nr:hypothetical protein [Chitinimonas sp. BJYL2]
MALLLAGGLILFAYYFAIQYTPTFDLQTLPSLLAAIAFDGVMLLLMLGAIFGMPAILTLGIPGLPLESHKAEVEQCNIRMAYAAWVAAFAYLILGSATAEESGLAGISYVLFGLALGLVVYGGLSAYRIAHAERDQTARKRWMMTVVWIVVFFVVAAAQCFPLFVMILLLSKSALASLSVELRELTKLALPFVFGGAMSIFIIHCVSLGRAGYGKAILLSVSAPLALTWLMGSPGLMFTLIAKEAKVGAFFIRSASLTHEGCLAVQASHPQQVCGDDKTRFDTLCHAYVQSRLGAETYLLFNTEPHALRPEDVRLTPIYIPSTFLASLTPDLTRGVTVTDDDIRRGLFDMARRDAQCGDPTLQVTELRLDSDDLDQDQMLTKAGERRVSSWVTASTSAQKVSIVEVVIRPAAKRSARSERQWGLEEAKRLQQLLGSQLVNTPIRVDWSGVGTGDCSAPEEDPSECARDVPALSISLIRRHI